MRGSFNTVNLIDVQYKDNIKQTLLNWKKILHTLTGTIHKRRQQKNQTTKMKERPNPITG